ncbi:hypothetical protein [Chryseobacterium sp. OSA05B]|uniref:hypothetical protein n=1 Tax=Chryseobacterium sp. OSA05B TaxID=2862650 RepID=UPI001CBE3D39|nr:hypothetical protein [Chryseobacterium sp. OSA05B]
MMTEVQENEVTDYLIFQKLPLDILLEVKDHMMSQISDIERKDNLHFEEAFVKTKRLWENEFKMTSYSVFYSEPIPVIVKKIIKGNNHKMLKKSFLLALISFVINLLLIYSSKSEEQYAVFFKVQNSIFFLAPVIVWAFHYKIRKFIRTDFKYKGKLFYTMYQQNIGLLVICLMSMAQVITKDGKSIYLFFKTQHHDEFISVLISLAFIFTLQTFMIFGLFNFFEHKKSLKKLQNFLQTAA